MPVIKKKSVTKTNKKSPLTIGMVKLASNTKGSITLPAVFETTAKDVLLAQAVRVYRANKRQGTASTKTRGEVSLSTRKIYRQKGTGNARHGSKKAPIFVGGGITFGPKPRDFSLKLPQKMRKKALFASIHKKLQNNQLTVVDSVEKVGPKTKQVVEMLKKLKLATGKTMLCAIDRNRTDFVRASRNIPELTVVPADQLTSYDVLSHTYIIFEKSALKVFESKKDN